MLKFIFVQFDNKIVKYAIFVLCIIMQSAVNLFAQSSQQCVPLEDILNISPANKRAHGKQIPLFTASLPANVEGYLSKADSGAGGHPLEALLCKISTAGDNDTIRLIPVFSDDNKTCDLCVDVNLERADYKLVIPQGYFIIEPGGYIEVDDVDISPEILENLTVGGAWHKTGSPWKGTGLFSFHDDDGYDGCLASYDGIYRQGYYTLLYPMLESLGIRGCISLEGRKAGWAGEPNKHFRYSDNTLLAKRMQDERGWEVMSHSMTCIGEILNNWVVDSLDSPLSMEILNASNYSGPLSAATTTVYSKETGKQYCPTADGQWWEESAKEMIKPFAGDYRTRKVKLYNPDYDAEYQWGEWFRLAEANGINGRSWVMHNGMSSHGFTPTIAEICPQGFTDMGLIHINEVPLMTVANRMLCEGQMFGGIPAESSEDNSYNIDQYEWLKREIKEAHERGGWLIMGMHAYRKCWKNSLPGALVSEGGDYPDEWVLPMDGVDPLLDPLTPPARLGITDWSEWYPCPGTRLRMMWDLLKYALEIGMVNVTSDEGFQLMGNKHSAGYFTKGTKIGYDAMGIEGTCSRYPHYVEGANGEVYYYNHSLSHPIADKYSIRYDNGTVIINQLPDSSVDSIFQNEPNAAKTAVSPMGYRVIVESIEDLPRGIWIIDGKKILKK